MVREYNYTLNSPTTLFLLNLPIRPSFQRDSTLIKQRAHSFAYFDCGWSVFLICLLIFSVSPSLSLFFIFFIYPSPSNKSSGCRGLTVCTSVCFHRSGGLGVKPNPEPDAQPLSSQWTTSTCCTISGTRRPSRTSATWSGLSAATSSNWTSVCRRTKSESCTEPARERCASAST